MATDPTWLTGLGLVRESEGVWREEETGLEVRDRRTRGSDKRASVHYRETCTPIWVMWLDKQRGTYVSSNAGFCSDPSDAPRFAAAVTLAARIAEAWNKQEELRSA